MVIQEDIYNLIRSMYKYCDAFDKIKKFADLPLREILRQDILRFLFYLSASDGVVKQTEVDFINMYLGYDYTDSELLDYIRENHIYSVDFENKVPFSLKVYVYADNTRRERGNASNHAISVDYLTCFNLLGTEFIQIDGDVDSQEVEDINIYLDNMRGYVQGNDVLVDFDEWDQDDDDDDEYVDDDGMHEIVSFLGKEYEIPNRMDIVNYRDLAEEIAREYANVLDVVRIRTQNAEKEEAKVGGNYGFVLQREFWDDVFDRGDAIESILEEMELSGSAICIEGDDESYYSRRTSGYRSLEKLADALEVEAKRIYYARESEIETGKINAYQNAASNIQGVGFGIITNSVVDLMFYNAVSNATLKSQAKKADAQYARESGASARAAYAKYTKQVRDLYYNQYIPAAERCIAIWSNEVFERALYYESQNDHPVFDEIKEYNQRDSKAIIESIGTEASVEVIKNKLHAAFELCPFDETIYSTAAELGVLDYDTFKGLAEYFSSKNEIIAKVEKYCMRNKGNLSEVETQIELLGRVQNASTTEVLFNICGTELERIQKAYKEIYQVIDDSISIRNVVVKLPCGESPQLFVDSTEEEIERQIINYVSSITSNVDIEYLIKQDLHKSYDFLCNNMDETDVKEINNKIVGLLYEKFLAYKKQMTTENNNYKKQKQEFQEKVEMKKGEIDSLEREADGLGFLKNKRKKELHALIVEKKEELYKFEKNNEPRFNWI